MARTWEPLGPAHIDELPHHCAGCLEWQLDAVEAPRARPLPEADRVGRKRSWLEGLAGPSGIVVRVDGLLAGVIAWAPPSEVPRAAALPTSPVTSDAVVMAGLWADDPTLYKPLVQRAVKELRTAGGAALEAFGGSAAVRGCASRPATSGGPCRWPTALLTRVGFHVVREHPTTPRLRLEVRRAVPALGALEERVGSLTTALSPRRGAEASLGRVEPQG